MDNNSLAHTKWNCKYHMATGISGVGDTMQTRQEDMKEYVRTRLQKDITSHRLRRWP